ncbi:MAG: shikimate dehydrogenase [Epsilonproteobacteria bacterium]|nr:shikimate dehydrogenase [Campylobacterota bacterium]
MKALFTIFGNPVAHSKSPLMHNRAFKELGVDACYGRYLLDDGQKLKTTFLTLGLKGANITVPHKEAAFESADRLEDFAREVRAVNTLVLKDGELHGYNTDAPGFYRALQKHGTPRNVLILGAGGTARALALYLKRQNVTVTVLNRSASRLQWFEEAGFKTVTWEAFEPASFDAVINTTSAGLEDESLPMPETPLKETLSRSALAVEVIYGKATPFLRLSASLNLPFFDGSEMLLQQGILAFDHFTDHRYALEAIERAMRPALSL